VAQYRPGQRVTEIAPPHRKGTIRRVQGTGINAVLWVGLDGWYLVAFRPGQVSLG
jgi:hypothetical protein